MGFLAPRPSVQLQAMGSASTSVVKHSVEVPGRACWGHTPPVLGHLVTGSMGLCLSPHVHARPGVHVVFTRVGCHGTEMQGCAICPPGTVGKVVGSSWPSGRSPVTLGESLPLCEPHSLTAVQGAAVTPSSTHPAPSFRWLVVLGSPGAQGSVRGHDVLLFP